MVRRIGAPNKSSTVKVVGMRSSMPYDTPSSITNVPVGPTIHQSKHTIEDATRSVLKTAKPSEIRAASKAGRAAVKAELEKRKAEKEVEDRLKKERQAAMLKMNKIRAEIEAIKQKESAAAINTKENGTIMRSKSTTPNDSVGSKDNLELPQKTEKSFVIIDKSSVRKKFEDLEKKELSKIRKCQEERATSRKNFLSNSSNHVPEMRRKSRKRDLFFDPETSAKVVNSTSSTSLSRISSDEDTSAFKPTKSRIVSKGNDAGIIREHSRLKIPDSNRDTQRKKLEEAKGHFEEGYQLCWSFQNSGKALVEYRKALFIRESLLGKYHEETGRTYYWIGRSLRKLKEYDEALVAFSRALRIFTRVLAETHKYRKWTEIAITDTFQEMALPVVYYESYKNDLDQSITHEVNGDNFRKVNSFTEAIGEYREAIKTMQDFHPDCADLHSKIAIILRKMGEFEKSLEENQSALEIYELSLGSVHPETVKNLNQMMEKKRLDQVSLALQEKLNIRE